MQHHATPDHAQHDPSLIAGHAAGDLADAQASAAAAILSTCNACRELHRDLVAIAAATRFLPRDARAPRDYRLTAAQAASLRRGSWLRALLRPFGAAQSAVRPMAAALSSIGVAGLLIAAFMPGMLGSAAGPTREDFEAAHAPAASAPTEDSLGPLAGNPDASDKALEADSSGAVAGAGGQVGGQSAAPAVRNGTDAGLDRPGTPSLLLVGSLGLLLVGLAMFGLRFAARRVR